MDAVARGRVGRRPESASRPGRRRRVAAAAVAATSFRRLDVLDPPPSPPPRPCHPTLGGRAALGPVSVR